jgi:hypothetical protein
MPVTSTDRPRRFRRPRTNPNTTVVATASTKPEDCEAVDRASRILARVARAQGTTIGVGDETTRGLLSLAIDLVTRTGGRGALRIERFLHFLICEVADDHHFTDLDPDMAAWAFLGAFDVEVEAAEKSDPPRRSGGPRPV